MYGATVGHEKEWVRGKRGGDGREVRDGKEKYCVLPLLSYVSSCQVEEGGMERLGEEI